MVSNANALVLEGDGVHKIKLFLARAKDCLIEQQQLFGLSRREGSVAVVEDLQNWALLKDPWLWDTGLSKHCLLEL